MYCQQFHPGICRGASLRLVACLMITIFQGLPTADAQPKPSNDFAAMLATVREQTKLPGVAAVVVRDGKVVANGAAGLRKLGDQDVVTVEDRFSIGSCTKRMTGLMIARLVDEGKLSFETTLASALPDVPMRDEYRPVTIAQLLAFTGGISAYERIGPKITPHLFDTEGTLAEREARFVKQVLQEPPAGAIGKDARYSNASYMLAAYIAAKAAGKSYEALMDEYVFRPLAMTQTGWGRPRSAERPAQPWLHIDRPDGYIPEPDVIRPPEVIFRAAGNAHMSIGDLGRFAQYELAAAMGKDPLLKPATSKRWHGLEGRPPSERAIHAGGTPWLSACYAVWPKQNIVAAIAANGGSRDDHICKAFVQAVESSFFR